MLEKLAGEADGQWVLAKVDVDANPRLAQALQVQSIPMVVAVIGGQLVDGFLGALPEAQVKQWISQVVAAAEHPDDVEAQSRVADIDVSAGHIEEAFDRLLGVVRRTSGDQRDEARRQLIGLFEIFPPQDPRVKKARGQLSSLLF